MNILVNAVLLLNFIKPLTKLELHILKILCIILLTNNIVK